MREVVTNITEEPEDLVHEREEQKMGVVSQLTAPCLKSIEEALEDGRCMCVLIRSLQELPLGLPDTIEFGF